MACIYVTWLAQVRVVEPCRCKIDVTNDVVAYGARADIVRVADHEQHLEGLLVHEALVEPAMLTEEETLVGRIDNDGILG